MRVSNFRPLGHPTTPINGFLFGTVDVTTGRLWWKETREVDVFMYYKGQWNFVSSGEPAKGVQALYSSYLIDWANRGRADDLVRAYQIAIEQAKP